MTAETLVASLGIYAGAAAVAAVSSFIPLVSIEVCLAALVVSRGVDCPSAALLVLCASAGQLAGKLPIYAAARGVTALPSHPRIVRLRPWLVRWARAPHLVLAASALLGLPPFSIMATVAGALAIRTRAFCAIVFAGRAVRFAIIVAIAAAAR